jgi:hypothetical protein
MRLMFGPLAEDRLEADAMKGKVFGQKQDKWMVTKFSKNISSQSFVDQADFQQVIDKQNNVDGTQNKSNIYLYISLHYPYLMNRYESPKESLYNNAKAKFIESIKYGYDSDAYKKYEETHNFSSLAGDFLYSALSKIIQYAPVEGNIIFYVDDRWAPRAKVWRILKDMKGMMPRGFFERIRVLHKNRQTIKEKGQDNE